MKNFLENFKTKLLEKACPKKISSSGWYVFNAVCCPYHKNERQDRRNRGNLLFENNGWVYNCFNCGYKARFDTNYPILGKKVVNLLTWFGFQENEINEIKKDFLKWKKEIQQDEKNEKLIDNADEKKEIEFFVFDDWLKIQKNVIDNDYIRKNFISISQIIKKISNNENNTNFTNKQIIIKKYLKEIDYLFSRGRFVEDYFDKIYLSENMKKIVLFTKIKNINTGIIMRRIDDKKPKYLNFFFTNTNFYNFNIIFDKNKEHVFLVEGVFDAMACDGIALLGNTPSKNQISILKSFNKKYCVIPDFDEPGKNLINVAIENDWGVCTIPEKFRNNMKDAAEMCKKFGKAFFLKLCYDNITYNKTKIELFMKLNWR